MTPLTPTEIEELRIAIAKCVGWKFGDGRTSAALTDPDGRIVNNHYNESWRLPLYTTSIDSIRDAAMEKFTDKPDGLLFAMALSDEAYCNNNRRFAWQLTALDWAIAFARTAKIWMYQV